MVPQPNQSWSNQWIYMVHLHQYSKLADWRYHTIERTGWILDT